MLMSYELVEENFLFNSELQTLSTLGTSLWNPILFCIYPTFFNYAISFNLKLNDYERV
jgi:hypothetical protein